MYSVNGSDQRETGAFAEGMHEDRPSSSLVQTAYSRGTRPEPNRRVDAERDRREVCLA